MLRRWLLLRTRLGVPWAIAAAVALAPWAGAVQEGKAVADSRRRRPVEARLVATTGAYGTKKHLSVPEDGAMTVDSRREAVTAAEIPNWPPVAPSPLLGSG